MPFLFKVRTPQKAPLLLCLALPFVLSYSSKPAVQSGAIERALPQAEFPAAPAFYGSAIGADDLNNVQIGGANCQCVAPGARVSFRFRAAASSSLSAIRIYTLQTATGYGGGTYGSLRITLQEDDGTAAHIPSGVVLAAKNVARPGSLGRMPRISIDSPPLTKGKLYHIVFANTDRNPGTNFVSTNSLLTNTPQAQMQPHYSDTDWAQLQLETTGGFDPGKWHIRRNMTPIMELDYADDTVAGVGYMEIWHPRTISGSNSVRQNFTVSARDFKVSSVSVRLAKRSGSGPLTISLERAEGSAIERSAVAAVRIRSTYSWVTYSFARNRVLTHGQAYDLVLTAPKDTVYEIAPIRAGSDYGFRPPTYFADGYAEFNDGSGWVGWDQWGEQNKKTARLQFYFTVVQ